MSAPMKENAGFRPVKKQAISVCFVEDHNEVLEDIYKAIGRKVLQFSDNTLIHFDSHPDMLLPHDLQASQVFDKHLLFEKLSIENWIIPAVYAGHFSTIVWIKPPWARQIPDQTTNFAVGEHKPTGKIRLSCAEPYFISELLWAPEDTLTNVKHVTLHVITLANSKILESTKLETHFGSEQENKISDISKRKNYDETPTDNSLEVKVKEKYVRKPENSDSNSGETVVKKCRLQETATETELGDNNSYEISASIDSTVDKILNILESQCFLDPEKNKYILDIDLDFYSTSNPFKEVYNELEYELLKRIYAFQKPTLDNLETCVQEREKHIAELRSAFQTISEGKPVPIITCAKQSDLEDLVSSLQHREGTTDWLWVHEIGCTFDDTELPHHISTDTQIQLLMQATHQLLSQLPRPTIITVARSSDDDYCPKHQVEEIQSGLIGMLDKLYENLHYQMHYKDD